jgi:hypothetical protein
MGLVYHIVCKTLSRQQPAEVASQKKKECYYEINADQISLSLTAFVKNISNTCIFKYVYYKKYI